MEGGECARRPFGGRLPQIIPTIKDPQIDSAYINQFAKFILPYIQQDYERELSQKDMPKESN